MKLAIQARPVYQMYLRNYHWTRSGKNKRRRVYTGDAKQEVSYTYWTDFTGPTESLDYLKQFKCVAFHSHLILHFGPQIWNKFVVDRQRFITENWHDQHYEFSYINGTPHTDDFALLCENPKRKPWYASKCLMVLLDFLMLGWFQRVIFAKNTIKADFFVRKMIY